MGPGIRGSLNLCTYVFFLGPINYLCAIKAFPDQLRNNRPAEGTAYHY